MQPRISATPAIIQQIDRSRQHASRTGDLSLFKKASAIFEVVNQTSYVEIADTFDLHVDTIRIWIKKFLAQGLDFFKPAGSSKGRPPKMTKTQK